MVPSDRRPRKQRARRDPVARELGQAQADIMNVFWRSSAGASVPELHEEINKLRARKHEDELAYTTVLTFVQRLHARKLLKRKPEGRGFRYWPTMDRAELLASWSDDLIDRLFADYGEAGVARLDERLSELDPARREKLRQARGKQ
jgi:BlaI family transcriptional regulator, penicillinase repressor